MFFSENLSRIIDDKLYLENFLSLIKLTKKSSFQILLDKLVKLISHQNTIHKLLKILAQKVFHIFKSCFFSEELGKTNHIFIKKIQNDSDFRLP